MAIHSSTLAWRIPWTEGPGGIQSTLLQRVRHDGRVQHTQSWPIEEGWKVRGRMVQFFLCLPIPSNHTPRAIIFFQPQGILRTPRIDPQCLLQDNRTVEYQLLNRNLSTNSFFFFFFLSPKVATVLLVFVSELSELLLCTFFIFKYLCNYLNPLLKYIMLFCFSNENLNSIHMFENVKHN